MFRYQVYGLYLDSALLLQGLNEIAEVPETDDLQWVTIRFGTVPDSLLDVRTQGILHQINHQQFRLEIPGIARYLVNSGQEIIIQPTSDSDEKSIAFFLLGPVFGALLHQRRILPLQASAVETPDGAIIFMGDSGIGKSSIAARLQQKGYRLITDDIAVIKLNQAGVPLVLPGYPELKLWWLSLHKLGYTEIDSLRHLRPQIEKYALPAAQFCDQSVRVRKIYLLNMYNEDKPSLEPLPDAGKLPVLLHNLYQQRYALEMRSVAAYWSTAVAVVEHTQILSLRRPLADFELEPIVELIERDLS